VTKKAMHAYSDPPPRSVARAATLLHHVRNRSSARVALTAEVWTPGGGSAFCLDTARADVEPGGGCCFASSVGSDLTLSLVWSGDDEVQTHQLRLPLGGGLPTWVPRGSGVQHGGLTELRLGPSLPQWLLTTEIQGPSPPGRARPDALRDLSPCIPDALRRAGCHTQALIWEMDPPPGCASGPCTVFGIPDGTGEAPPAVIAVPDVALFFDGSSELEGVEGTADGGKLRYSLREGVLRIDASSPLRLERLSAEVRGALRTPFRTRERQRIVYALPAPRHTLDLF